MRKNDKEKNSDAVTVGYKRPKYYTEGNKNFSPQKLSSNPIENEKDAFKQKMVEKMEGFEGEIDLGLIEEDAIREQLTSINLFVRSVFWMKPEDLLDLMSEQRQQNCNTTNGSPTIH